MHHTIEELPMPARVIRKMDKWGTKLKIEDYGNKLQFLNYTKHKFDWDNYELDDNGELVKEESVSHPGIPAELTGINL